MDDDHCILGGQKRGKDHSKAAFLLNPIGLPVRTSVLLLKVLHATLVLSWNIFNE